MRILQVNKFLYRRAGAESYFLDLANLLAIHGHQVMMWGTNAQPMIHDSRFMIHQDLLVDYLNFDRRDGLWQDLRKVGHMLWSREAAAKFEQVMREFKPDLVHIHNIYHHISPSILPVAARFRVPLVMTVHDWHLINPNYSLFDHGAVCERNGLRAIAHRCIKNSYAATFADVLEWRLHRMLRVYERYVVKFIVPNEFVKGKLIKGGVEDKKIEVVPLPVAHNPPQPSLTLREGDDRGPPLKVRGGRGSYVLYAGRLTVEKGIYVFLEIAKQLPEIQFKIAGTGPEWSNVKCQMSNVSNVELLGFVEKEKLQTLIAGARLILAPSLWYDLSPLAVLEAMAAGKVVVASAIGGIPELIQDGKTGFLVGLRNYEMTTKSTKSHNSPQPPLNLRGGVEVWVDPVVEVRHHPDCRRGAQLCAKGAQSDFHYWVDTIREIYYDEKLLNRVGKAAAEYVAREHNPEEHYEKIVAIYRAVGH